MSTTTNYPQVHLGGPDGPLVSAIGYGAMGIGSSTYGVADEAEALAALTRAADLGTTFWDTSDAYGASQAIIGKWFAQTGRRKEIFFATKFGAVDTRHPRGTPGFYKLNSKPSFIKMKIEESLKVCQTDYIDLYYQHRVDSEVPVEIVMETFRPYLENGTIRYVGLSECSIDVMKRAKAVPGVGEKLVAVQMEYNPFELELETTGFADVARELNISVVAYCPLGRGLMTGLYKSRADFEKTDIRQFLPRFSDENFASNITIVDKFKGVAAKHNATTGQVTLAWIMARQPGFISIPGTRKIERLEENAAAAFVKLDEEDMKELNGAVDAAETKGERFPPAYAAVMNRECIPLSEWKGEEGLWL
ncbi:NADP-dependent oxidoreductase domain-containing protein [Cristinia sonorae]|uniref:NADP-dependent oxidoreductase domain-containing protein n=1 Tax=Cristinia sonorae TaxID=1940300 RepID=A0A8K0UQU4_9AGAR|nr:NADP-dependent oxidoreductase domain-containing protein [Cristinia sonorae]